MAVMKLVTAMIFMGINAVIDAVPMVVWISWLSACQCGNQGW